MVSFADAARARATSTLPGELIRAWEPPTQIRKTAKPDEWTSTGASGAGQRIRRARRALVAATVVAAAAVVISAAAIELTGGTTPGQSQAPSAPKLVAPKTYSAGGLPFRAAFPSRPVVSRDQLHLLRLPYKATVYTSVVGSSSVTVGVYPLPLGKAGNYNFASFVKHFVADGGTAPAGTSLSAGSTTTFQGEPSVNIAATSNGGASAGFGTMVFDGHIVYEVLAMGPATTVDATFQQVMKHFRLVNPALGTAF